MHTEELIKILVSIVFIYIGASIFFLASLISGKNIFKDHNSNSIPNISAMLVGVIPFLLLPIGFVILLPDFFIQNPINDYDKVFQIHRLIFNKFFFPFLLTCLGFGIVIGCLQALHYSNEFMKNFIRISKLNLLNTNYNLLWDNFLRSLKKDAYMEIKLDNGSIITGEKIQYSIREEKNTLWLKNFEYNNKNNDTKSDNKDLYDILVIENSKITSIFVEESAFKKHYDIMDHSAQASYRVLLSIGFLLILFSITLTISYFNDQLIDQDSHHIKWFLYLIKFYELAWWLSFGLMIFFTISVILTLKGDYQNHISSLIFNKNISYMFLFLFFVEVIMPRIIITQNFTSFNIIELIIYSVLFLSIILIYLHNKDINNRMKHHIQSVDKSCLKKILHWYYIKMNLNNNSGQKEEYEKIKSELNLSDSSIKMKFGINTHNQKKYSDAKEVCDKLIKDLIDFRWYLKEEELNIILYLKDYLDHL